MTYAITLSRVSLIAQAVPSDSGIGDSLADTPFGA
jgi:hypothetical protein